MNGKVVGFLGVSASKGKNRHSNNKFSKTKNNSPSSMLYQYQTDSILSHFLMLSKDKHKFTHKNQNSNDISLKLSSHHKHSKPQNMKFLNINPIHKGVTKGFNCFTYKNNITTPCTTNHSRKHSNEHNKQKSKNTKQSQSVSVSKTKKNILKGNNNCNYYTYKEIKNLFSKYSIFNKLNYTNNNSKTKSKGEKQHKQQTTSVSHRNSKYNKYNDNKNKRKPKKKKMIINLKQHKPINTHMKNNIAISIHIPPPLNNNYKTINTKNSLQSNTDYLTLPYNTNNNNNNSTSSTKKPTTSSNIKRPNIKIHNPNNTRVSNIHSLLSKLTHNIDSIIPKFKTQNNTNNNTKRTLLLPNKPKDINVTTTHFNSKSTNNQKQRRNSTKTTHIALSQNTKTHTKNNSNDNNNNNNTSSMNQSFSTSRESNYYKNESKKLIDYIKSFSRSSIMGITYPKTTIHFYKIGRLIGHGAFGKVNLALHVLSGHIVAIKSFNKTKKHFSKNKILYEIKLLQRLRSHRNIVQLFEKFETKKYFCIVMEHISGGNLLQLINKCTKLSEKTTRYIFKQLIDVLKYIHSKNIVHRDIKPDNILIDLNNTIKLCDFGVGKEIKQNTSHIYDPCGTPAFVAPELLIADKPYNPYPTDIWSAGVVLYTMLSGYFPFRGNNDNELNEHILQGKYAPILDITQSCSDLMSKLLETNPLKRITLQQIEEHPWMKMGNSDDIISPMFSKDIHSCMLFTNENFFTNAERIIYSKLRVDYRNAKKEDLIENFTYKNIDSDIENESQVNINRSIVNTPFNSPIKNVYRYDEEDEVFFDLNIENCIMKFYPKVQEMNIQYEVNFNAEADRGYVKDSAKKRKRAPASSLNTSFNNRDEILIEERRDSSEKEREQSEDNSNNSFSNVSNVKCKAVIKKNDFPIKNKEMVIDENALRFVEGFGYNKGYVVKSLQQDLINHATACYYLKISLLMNKK